MAQDCAKESSSNRTSFGSSFAIYVGGAITFYIFFSRIELLCLHHKIRLLRVAVSMVEAESLMGLIEQIRVTSRQDICQGFYIRILVYHSSQDPILGTYKKVKYMLPTSTVSIFSKNYKSGH